MRPQAHLHGDALPPTMSHLLIVPLPIGGSFFFQTTAVSKSFSTDPFSGFWIALLCMRKKKLVTKRRIVHKLG